MNTCIKKVVDKTYKWLGGEQSWICGKPVSSEAVEAGLQLCSKHYKAHVLKMTPWGQRSDYRDATDDDMRRSRSLKLKTECINRLYICRKGQIWSTDSTDNGYRNLTILPVDPQLFCVKK